MSFDPLSSGAQFYKEVMSLKVNKTKPKKKKPKVEKKKRIKSASKQERNLLSIFEGADADFLSDHRQQAQYFEIKLKGLSKDELKKLKQKMQDIINHIFEEQKPSEKTEHLTTLTRTHIELKLRQSETHIANLTQKIVQRLCRMNNPALERSANQRRYIAVEEKQIPIRTFADDHFLDIIEEYEWLVSTNSIITDSKLLDGNTFVCHVITTTLE